MEPNLQSVAQLAKRFPFTETQCRWWIKNAEENGLAHAIERVGSRVLIDTEKFEVWLRGRRRGGDA